MRKASGTMPLISEHDGPPSVHDAPGLPALLAISPRARMRFRLIREEFRWDSSTARYYRLPIPDPGYVGATDGSISLAPRSSGVTLG